MAKLLPYKRDGSGITVGQRTHLHWIDTVIGELRALTQGDFDVTCGAWSPDGKRLAFVRHRSGRQRHRTDLCLAGPDGEDARVVVEQFASIEAIAWPPDGSRLLPTAGKTEGESRVQLWLVETDGGEPRQLGDDDFELSANTKPLWHPHGRRAATIGDVRGLHRLAIVDVEAGTVRTPSLEVQSVEALAQCGDRLCMIATSMRDLMRSTAWTGTATTRARIRTSTPGSRIASARARRCGASR